MAQIIGGDSVAPVAQRRGGGATSARCVFSAFAAGCLLAAALVVPTAVFAAVAAPDAGGSLDLQTWPESGKLIIVTSIGVPEAVELPVTVRVPVPEGATVQWAGEVLGGDPSADPARPYKVIKSPVGGQYAEFTIEGTHSAQVDSEMSALKVNGDVTSASFDWIQSVASPFTSFSVRVPANALDIKISPPSSAPPEVGVPGQRLYPGDPVNLQPGQKQTVAFSYSAAAANSAASASGLSTLVVVLIAALVIAIVVLIVLVVRQRQAPVPTELARRGSSGTPTRGATPGQGKQSGKASDDDWGFDDEG